MILSIASAATALYAFKNVANSNRLGSESALTLATVTSEISRHSDIIIALTQQAPTLASPAGILAAKQAAIDELEVIHVLAGRLDSSLPLPAARQKLGVAEGEYRDDIEVLFDQLTVRENLQNRRFQSISDSRQAVTAALDQLAGISSRYSLEFSALIEKSATESPASSAAASLRKLIQVKDIIARLQSIESALVIVRTAASTETLGSAQQRMSLDVRSILRETRRISDAATGEALRPVIQTTVADLNDPDGSFALARDSLAAKSTIATASEAGLRAALAIKTLTEGYVEAAATQATRIYAESQERIDSATALVVGFTALAFVASCLIVWLLIYRDIVSRAQSLIQVTRRLASGDLAAPVQTDGDDELTDVAEALERFRLNAERVLEQERALFAMNRDLTRTNKELGQFAYIASHDLQEPLRIVASYCELLERRYSAKLDDDAREFIGYAVEAAGRMRSLIDDLLSYSRLGREPIGEDIVDLTVAAKAAEEKYADEITSLGVRLEISGLPKVKGAQRLLTAVFEHLIANAIKFRSEAPLRIQVSAEANGPMWNVRIKDNGIGVSADQVDRIFQIFQRLHTRTEYAGNGIGLTLVRRILEMHGGEIGVSNCADGGAEFVLSLPVVDLG